MRKFFFSGLMILVALTASGCGAPPGSLPPQDTPAPAPTVSSIFSEPPTLPPAPTREPTTELILPTSNPTVAAQATVAALDVSQLQEVVIYDDQLSPDWSLDQSFQIGVSAQSRDFAYHGSYSLKAEPVATTGILYFTLKKTAEQTFRRSRVQALRFYLSGGSEPISNDALTVAVIGSNANPYWVKDDTSVKLEGRVTDNQPLFSETRLSFLGINTAIPPKTFAEVTVWLDSLLYDPTYTYVTGFYLKTDKESVPSFYVDQVSLLLAPEAP